MINLDWANEQHPQGFTKEQLDQARQQQSQVELAAARIELSRIPQLRAQATEMIAVLMPGAAQAALRGALSALDGAESASGQVVAVRQLNNVIQLWAQAAWLDRDLERSIAPAAARADARRAAEERARPVVLTIEERVARIEQVLGLS